MQLKIFTDGGSRNNPGHAAYGYVISDATGRTVAREGKYIGIETNNVAEYTGILEALKKAAKICSSETVESIACFLDSNLIVQQLNGKFKIKAVHLKPIIDEIRILLIQLPPTTFTHVPRAQNIKADALVNQALDDRL